MNDNRAWAVGVALALGACAAPAPPPPPPAPAAAATLELPVSPKLDPDPIPAPLVTPLPPAQRCDFQRTLAADTLFSPDHRRLTESGAAQLDQEVLEPLKACARVELVTVTGYADRIGSASANQALSEARAETVKAFLVARGVPSERISALGMGSKTSVSQGCTTAMPRQLYSECLAPDRRVTVEVRGTKH